MLKEKDIEYTFREYSTDPLSEQEIRDILRMLAVKPSNLLRKREATKVGLTGTEPDEELIARMASNPRLVQRPIAIQGDRALIARPADTLNDWL